MIRKAAIIFARMSSIRLPGKPLIPMGNGFLLIELIIKQLQRLPEIKIILATSTRPEDDRLAEVAANFGALLFRGDLNNVAKRTVDCINHYQIDVFCRINGDSPFVCSGLLEESFGKIENVNLDFITNIYPRSFPYGYSLEVFRSSKFISFYPQFSIEEQEHITSYFYNNISQFKYENVKFNLPVEGNIRLTIDTKEDYKNLNELFVNNPKIHLQPVEEIISAYKDVVGI